MLSRAKIISTIGLLAIYGTTATRVQLTLASNCQIDRLTSPSAAPADVFRKCKTLDIGVVETEEQLQNLWNIFDIQPSHPGLDQLTIKSIRSDAYPFFLDAVLATLLSNRIKVRITRIVIKAKGVVSDRIIPPDDYLRSGLEEIVMDHVRMSRQVGVSIRDMLALRRIRAIFTADTGQLKPAAPLQQVMRPYHDNQQQQQQQQQSMALQAGPSRPPRHQVAPAPIPPRNKLALSFKNEFANSWRAPGLKNLRNTCYLNSAIQILFYLRPFREVILPPRPTDSLALPIAKSAKITLGLRDLFQSMQKSLSSSKQATIDPLSFIKLVARHWRSEDVYQQNDAPEFIEWLLRSIHEEENTGIGTIVDQLFKGEITKKISCLRVPCESVTKDEFYEYIYGKGGQSAALGETNNKLTLDSMIRNAFAESYLTGADQYDANEFGKQDAVEKLSLSALPIVLNLHLRRNLFDRKINTPVEFPLLFDLRNYITLAMEDQKQETKYSLYGFILHQGTPQLGHYRAVIRVEYTQWMLFDDDRVEQIDFRDILAGKFDEHIYYLTYIRDDAI